MFYISILLIKLFRFAKVLAYHEQSQLWWLRQLSAMSFEPLCAWPPHFLAPSVVQRDNNRLNLGSDLYLTLGGVMLQPCNQAVVYHPWNSSALYNSRLPICIISWAYFSRILIILFIQTHWFILLFLILTSSVESFLENYTLYKQFSLLWNTIYHCSKFSIKIKIKIYNIFPQLKNLELQHYWSLFHNAFATFN